MKNEKKLATIYKIESGFYWLYELKNGEFINDTDLAIDGDKRLYVVKDMAKRWNYKLIKLK